jgi:RsmE family RNA methyltransferase
MNWLLLEPFDIPPDSPVVLRGEQARHAREVLHAAPGQRLRLGIVDGPLGNGEVLSTDPDGSIRLRADWDSVPPPRPRIDLLLAMPRPKVMRRLWPVLASLGVGRIFVTNAWKVERGYFDTPALDPATIRSGLLEGLRQAGDTLLPEVTIHRRLRPLVEDVLPMLPPYSFRWIAHPDASTSTPLSTLPSSARTLLAIGPEGGWIPDEVDLFRRHGFAPLSLGPRILRTDTACAVLLGLLHAAGA